MKFLKIPGYIFCDSWKLVELQNILKQMRVLYFQFDICLWLQKTNIKSQKDIRASAGRSLLEALHTM